MKLIKPLLLIVVACFAFPVFAQEGYPLDGTWRGEWGMAGGEQTLAVVVMDWDGTTINGRINPGRNTISFTNATLDASGWRVHIDAQTREGQPVVIDGVLGELGSYNRTLTGTWTQNGMTYPLVLTRE